MGEREKRWDKMHALITYLIVTLIFFFFFEREKPNGGMSIYIYIYIYMYFLLLKFYEMVFFFFKLFYSC